MSAITTRQLVLEAFGSFSPLFQETAEQFFANNWIDAQPRLGKANGAFCAYVTPDVHPYVLMNFEGRMEDVSVLAHELGHGIHAAIARNQSFLNFNWPITLAEVASVFGEMLLFDHLKKQVKNNREQLALHMGLLDRIVATVFRQISMYRFEQALHRARREQGELTPDQINQLWRSEQKKLHGRSVTLTDDYNLWWSYIPHFIHMPFYVYAYAFGELLTLALYAQYQAQGPAFVEGYTKLLQAGGSQSPSELFKPLGIDLTEPSFWRQGLGLVKTLLRDTSRLV